MVEITWSMVYGFYLAADRLPLYKTLKIISIVVASWKSANVN